MNTQIKYQNLNPTLMENYEIIAAYFVNLYYNEIYNKSINIMQTDGKGSLTEIYTNKIHEYMKFITKNKDMGIKQLHGYYQNILSRCTIKEYEERFLSLFIPQEYLSVLSGIERGANLASILEKIIREFSLEIIKKYLPHIIDKHSEKTNVRMLQDMVIDKMMRIREEYFNNLLAVEKNAKSNTTAGANDKNELKRCIDIIKSLASRIDVLVEEKRQLEEQLKKYRIPQSSAVKNNAPVVNNTISKKQPTSILQSKEQASITTSNNSIINNDETTNKNDIDENEVDETADENGNEDGEEVDEDAVDESEQGEEQSEEQDEDNEDDFKKKRMERLNMLKTKIGKE